MILCNASYNFVDIDKFHYVEFTTVKEENRTVLKVWFLDVSGEDNLVYANVDKIMSSSEKFKAAHLLAKVQINYKDLDDEILSKYLNGIFVK